ncbi:hypothetical protein D9M69_45120 [compost metagenome]|nr:hypothetical protein N184_03160 [Sinorhizobium sp. GL28]
MEFSGESSSQKVHRSSRRLADAHPPRLLTSYHESARELVRVRTVVAFLQELVTAEHQIFV